MSIYTNTVNFNTFVTQDVIDVCIRRLDTSMIKKLIACKISKANLIPHDITVQPSHGEFKTEFFDFKLSSYKESDLNFAPNMFP